MNVSAIKQMEQYAREHEEVISLSQGIPSVFSDIHIRTSVQDAIMNNLVDKYSDPQGMLILRQKICETLEQQAMAYAPDEIIVTTGAVEAMVTALLSVTSPTDQVIVLTPTYSAFHRAAETARVKVLSLQLKEGENWTVDIELLRKKLSSRTKAIILCNPNNPTGTIYKKSELREIAELAAEHNVFLIIDEVYSRMLFNDKKWYSPAQDARLKKQVIRIESFSKNYALSGWRIGFLHADRSVIERMLPIHDALVNCAPVISQYAALAAYERGDAVITGHMAEYKEKRRVMGDYLTQLTSRISFTYPVGTYFFFPRIRGVSNTAALSLDILQKVGLAVVPGEEFGPGGEGHIRLCFGREIAAIHVGMERLLSYFRTYA
jgi:aminotransferase